MKNSRPNLNELTSIFEEIRKGEEQTSRELVKIAAKINADRRKRLGVVNFSELDIRYQEEPTKLLSMACA